MRRVSARWVIVLFLSLWLNQGGVAWAGQAVLTWDPSPDAVSGYKVYTGTVSGIYLTAVDVGTGTTYTVPNLIDGLTYYFAVTAYDGAGNESPSSNEVSKAIPLAIDLTPPILSSITVGSLTLNSATISWSSNEVSSSRVVYGATASYGASTPGTPDLVTAHTQTLTGLQPGTLYHFSALSRDAAGNLATSQDGTFTTLGDGTAPSTPAGVTGTVLSATQINLTWSASTDNLGVTGYRIYRNGTQVASSATPGYLDGGLTANTTYSYTVAAYDAAGNLSAASSARAYTTLPLAPVLSQTAATGMTSSGATLSGTVNPSGATTTAWFEYGTTTAYGSSTPVATVSATNTISATLASLTASTTYHFRLAARNAGGTTYGPDAYFLTLAPPTVAPPPVQGPPPSISSYTLTQDPYAWVAAPIALTLAGDDNSTTAFLPFPFPFYGQTYKQLYLSTNGLITFGGANTAFIPQSIPGPAQPNAFIAPFWRDLYVGMQQITFASSDTEFVIAFNGVRDLCCSAPTHTFEVVLRPDGTILFQYGAVTMNAPTGIGIENQDGSVGISIPTVSANSGFRFTPNTAAAPPSAADTTAPVLSGMGTGSVTASSAVIGWSTDELSDTQVEYGATTSYGLTSPLVSTMVTAHSQSLTGLASSTLYHYRVRSKDAAGNLAVSTDGIFTTVTPPDTSAPSAPTGLAATVPSSTQINLSWSASTDNVGVTGYRLYRNGTQIATPTGLTYSDGSLTPDTAYSYTVAASDAAGNLSAQSAAISARTLLPPDTAPPVFSGIGASGVTQTGATVGWTTNEPATTQVAYGTTTAYGSFSTLNTALVSAHTVSLTGLTASTTYHYQVISRDAAGNVATSSDAIFITTAIPDTTAPSVPAGLAATVPSSTQINLSWSASTDNIGVTGYRVYRNGTQVATPSGLTYSDGGLTANTAYSYTVAASDAAGNLSAQSAAISARTLLAPDTTPPVISAVAAGSITSTSVVISWTTNEVADSQVDYGTTASYGTTTAVVSKLIAAHSQTLTGLLPSTLYHYRVRSKDPAGNVATSADAIFVTAAPPVSTPTTVTLSPAADTYLNLDTSVNSTDVTLNTYTWPDNQAANTVLMKFNLSSIPAGAVIQSATLNLSLVEADIEAEPTYTVTVHKVINKNPDLTRATGYTYDGVNGWTANACCYDNVPLAEQDISAPYDTKAIDKVLGRKNWTLTAMVQEWINAPTTNFGLMLNSDATKEADRYRFFASMENPTAAIRPSLTVTYQLP
ncbi:MAG: fibronectin type III domain-containing protein [Nitrospirae bacterium]|nr:fibronectin type III domain-containing protein [Candidatus Manganitrophaceae bacterium]